MKPEDILKIRMQQNDAGAETIGDYLCALLIGIWVEGEGFSGKRPFGNSGWKFELYIALLKGGAVDGTFEIDEDGEIFDWDISKSEQHKADDLIFDTIAFAFNGVRRST